MAESPSKSGPGPIPAGSPRSAGSDRDLRDRLGVARTGPGQEQVRMGWRWRLLETGKTLIWVVPLTILIWIYAEREQLVPMYDVRVPVDVRIDAEDRIVTLVDARDHHLSLDLQGPRRSLQAVRDKLLDQRTTPLSIRVPNDLPVGIEQQVVVTDAIVRNELFTSSAVSVSNVRPAMVRVRVEEKLVRKAEVRHEPTLVGTVKLDPSTVTLEGPASALRALPADRPLVIADLSRFVNRPAGTYGPEEIALRLEPALAEVNVVPATVSVTVEKRESEPLTLNPIPVQVQLPAQVLEADTHKVVASQVTLRNVTVSGPPDAIQQLKTRTFNPPVGPSVVLELRPEDLEPGKREKRLRQEDFRLPPGVVVSNLDIVLGYEVSLR